MHDAVDSPKQPRPLLVYNNNSRAEPASVVIHTLPFTPTPPHLFPSLSPSHHPPLLVYFLPFFFFPPCGVAGGVAAGVAVVEGVSAGSTMTGSSSLAALVWPFSDAPSSAGCCCCWGMGSVLTSPRRLSHHSLSCSSCASISSRRSRRTLFAAISLADWKMIWPQPGRRALACGATVSGRE